MKRCFKNIICIFIIIIMSAAMVFTINYAKNHNNNQIGSDMKTPPAMPEKTNDDKPSNDNQSSDTQRPQPPTENNGDMKNNMEEPPAMPDGNSNNLEGNINNNQMGGEPKEMNNMNSKLSISWIYYLIFGIESLIISSIIIYFIMSKFNKKTFKETFINTDKVIISVLSVIILSSGITYLDTKLINKNVLTNKTDKNNNQNSSVNYSSKKEITEDTTINEGTFESTSQDENAISVNGGVTATLSNISVTKTCDSDGGDNTSFYGTNSAIIAKSGANLTLKNISVKTNATGANGVFSYGGSATTNNSSSDGTTITISDSSITTLKDNSGGIMTTGGGNMNAYNLTINTSGTSSAAIRTDRGGGNVTVEGGTYTTNGQGSPAIYSTANIKVSNAKLISNASEGIVIEGKNSVTIEDTELIDSNTKLNGKSTTYKNVFLYQSMSGDAANGNSEFIAKNSKIITNKGDSFYVTNTTAIINLINNTIVNNDTEGNFLRIKSDSWGNSGSNGGDVTLNLSSQKVSGNIVVDSISTLDITMNNSYFEGIINKENSAKKINLKMDKNSTIKLTGDSYVTSFTNDDSTNSNIDFNGYKLYVNGTAIN